MKKTFGDYKKLSVKKLGEVNLLAQLFHRQLFLIAKGFLLRSSSRL
jgi:hypothetical protein